MDENLQATVLLQHLPGLGPARYWRLLECFSSPRQVLQQSAHELHLFLPEEARAVLAEYQQRGPASALGQKLLRDLDWLDAHPDVHLIDFNHPSYPQLLQEVARPPALLYVKGNQACLSFPQLAIVGSRNPTPGGRDNAFAFARYLAAHGFTITSGLALGIDGAAHQGALAAAGHTIAVFGTGIDRIYPSRHRQLAEQILAEGGAWVSEFPLATRSHAGNFPQRNRLISGLSLGTLVVEAAVQSGSLITARLALQQNREVFAIPGSIHNPLARGCHHLIREGATLTETGEDIVAQLGGLLAFKQEESRSKPSTQNKPNAPKSGKEPPSDASTVPHLDKDEQALLANVGFDPTPFETLVERSGLSAGQLSAQLMGLELKGAICATSQGYSRRN
jgi:DNA processing protein